MSLASEYEKIIDAANIEAQNAHHLLYSAGNPFPDNDVRATAHANMAVFYMLKAAEFRQYNAGMPWDD